MGIILVKAGILLQALEGKEKSSINQLVGLALIMLVYIFVFLLISQRN